MKLIVNAHTVEIKKTPVNEKEIDITKCVFEFAEEITSEYVKEAYFTYKGETYKQIIVNNECAIPYEVLQEKGTVEVGVVAYLVENEEEIKRYNPSPAYFDTWLGSLKDNADNSEPITPSEMEQYEQALQDGLTQVSNVDIDAQQTSSGATITITNRNNVEKTVTIANGVDGADGADGQDATINGVNAINIEAGNNITLDQQGSTLTISATGGGSGGGSEEDNVTITKNSQQKIQTVGIIDRNTGNADKIWTGTTQQYNAIQNKDGNTFYYITDDDTTLVSDIQINNNSIVSSGTANIVTKTAYNSSNNRIATENDLPDISGKQDTLVSGTNIKTINNTSLLGSGNITISGGGGTATDVQINGTSIVSNNTANIITNTAYNSSSNKIATMSDVPDISGKQDKIVIETPTQTTITIEPNKYYSFGEVASLNITLGTPTDNTVYNEYMFEFDSGSTATSLTLPNTVEWVQTPTIQANKTYQVSIVNNIGIIVGV